MSSSSSDKDLVAISPLIGIGLLLIFGYLGATRYIPVSLAVLIFYTDPFFVFFIFLFVMDDATNPIAQTGVLSLCGTGLALGFAYITFYAGLKIIGPVRASMLLNTEPICTIGLSIAILGERLSLGQFVGAGLIIAGIILINYQPKPNRITIL
jgi:drug/metabolite transporter (DMT)-like permease